METRTMAKQNLIATKYVSFATNYGAELKAQKCKIFNRKEAQGQNSAKKTQRKICVDYYRNGYLLSTFHRRRQQKCLPTFPTNIRRIKMVHGDTYHNEGIKILHGDTYRD